MTVTSLTSNIINPPCPNNPQFPDLQYWMLALSTTTTAVLKKVLHKTALLGWLYSLGLCRCCSTGTSAIWQGRCRVLLALVKKQCKRQCVSIALLCLNLDLLWLLQCFLLSATMKFKTTCWKTANHCKKLVPCNILCSNVDCGGG